MDCWLLKWSPPVYINLPVCLLALAVIAIALRGVNPGTAQVTSWGKFARTFDFLGLCVFVQVELVSRELTFLQRTLFMCGSSCVIIGFSFAGDFGCELSDCHKISFRRMLTRHDSRE
jgi:hypothetical protein